MIAEDLFYSGETLEDSAYARILLKAQPKIGKTIAVTTTAPEPVLTLNCDGRDGLQPARRHGAKLPFVKDIQNHKDWMAGCKGAAQLANEGKVSTIFVDSLTLLVNDILVPEFNEKFAGTKDEGFGVYRETLVSISRGCSILRKANAHLIVSVHVDQELKLDMSGQTKELLPRLLNDIVYMDFNVGRKPPRAFHVGPSASGLTGARSSDENKVIDANVKTLLDTLGLAY